MIITIPHLTEKVTKISLAHKNSAVIYLPSNTHMGSNSESMYSTKLLSIVPWSPLVSYSHDNQITEHISFKVITSQVLPILLLMNNNLVVLHIQDSPILKTIMLGLT